ncbi:glycosyltransferase family 1 protein [Rossellomorea marisflavi]|uniref:glycosyltransferase family 1 protein n=1 Tax=Rossellomorea marisflavi TaxID=189381 RepID=UPI0034576FEA
MFRPIRILHVLGALNRGGAETMVMNLYRNIDREKVQFDFVIHTNEKCDFHDEIISLGGKIYSFPRYKGVNHFQYIKTWKKFFSYHSEYKIIHGHMRSTASIYLSIAKGHGCFTIAHSHSIESRGNIIERLVKNTLQIPLRYIPDYFFACSDEAGSWLFGEKTILKENYAKLNNSINISDFTFSKDKREETRILLGIKNELLLGHVGSFTQPKNHKFLIEIFFEIQQKNKDAKLLLIGSGELQNTIIRQVEELGISEKVLFLGSVPNVNDYMQAMDIFVFPSIFEGLGMAALESQASGLRTIISDHLPEDIRLTKLISVLSLKEDAKSWSNTILKCNCTRLNVSSDLIKHGYDISETSTWIQKYYLSVSSKYAGE